MKIFLVENFLKKSDFIINNNDTDLYDYSIKAGGAIIFDEGGSHRGSSPTLNDRIVLRYLFSKFKINMRIIIFGGSGFLGKNLAGFFQKKSCYYF